jgi:TRAP-type C4-dicarboxylate transport system substrate-binding protein
MWTWQGESLAEEFIRGVGFTNLNPLPMPEVLTSLQTGLVNGCYGPYYTTLALQWYSQVKYMTSINFGYTPGAIAITKPFWQKLPDDLKKLLLTTFQKHTKSLISLSRKDDETAFNGMKKNGLQVVDPDEQTHKEMMEKVEVVVQKNAGQIYSKALLDEMRKKLDEHRKSKASVNKQP